MNNLSVGRKIGLILMMFLLLNAAGFLVILNFINDQRMDGKIINIAGSQRMLSQKMTKEAFLAVEGDAKEKENLKNTASKFDKVHQDLLNGNKAEGIPAVNQQIKEELSKVTLLWSDFRKNVQVILENQSTVDQERSLVIILENNMDLLTEMNHIVSLLEADSLQKMSRLKWIQTILLAANLLFLILGILISRAMITNPIRQIAEEVKKVAKGDLSSISIQVKSKDEIGQLSEHVNMMASQLRQLIRQVNYSAEQVAASSEHLSASAEQTSMASEQIAAAIQEVAKGSEKQVNNAAEANRAVSEISCGMEQTASSIQMVADSAVTANENASNGTRLVDQTMEQMNAVQETVNRISQVVSTLGQKTKEIDQIIGLITQISSQTNLLALNAAIEAARAGEHGRGFAIVADEVRKLAEESGKSTEQIRKLIGEIQAESDKAAEVMNHGTVVVKQGIDMVKETGESFHSIVRMVQEISSQSQEVSAIVQEVNASSHSMVETMEMMANISEQTSGNTQHVAAAAEEQTASMEEITASSFELARMADELKNLVRNFKV